jgi:hypothetical protein
MTNLDEVYSEWQNNLTFREHFKKDPVQALKEAGFELSPQDLIKIQSMVKLKEDEELDKRA